MRWKRGRRSQHVEDRRGTRLSPGARGSRIRKGGLGGGLGLVVIVLIAMFFGVDPMVLLQGLPSGQGPEVASRQAPPPAEQEELRDFVSVVLADTEDTWNGLFARMNRNYEEPSLVLFTGAVQSVCGFTQAAVGPFYCPGDRKVYLDLSFFDELRVRFRAPGDFAQAYVIAHEVGHHIQTLLGIERQVRQVQQQVGRREANGISVMVELQADCFAGDPGACDTFSADRL